MPIAPNASYHYVMGGIKGNDLTDDQYARPLVGIRQKDFEDANEISTETDEGHTGISSINQGSYRTNAESAPTWEDKFRYGEFLEDIFYLLLGTVTKNTHKVNNTDMNGIFDYHFELPPNNSSELPLATLYNGYAKSTNDARVFNNALLNELEINFSADDVPTITPTFISDYNNMNLVNPTRAFATTSFFAKAVHTQMYIGDVGATPEEMLANPINCFIESNLTINNNAESQSCHADAFGKNTKRMGEREATGSITMPWLEEIKNGVPTGTKLFEAEYEAFNKYGHVVSEEITHKQVWYRVYGGDIPLINENVTVNSGVPFETLIKCPDVELTNVTSTKSGNEAKDLTMEYNILEKPTHSYITVDITTFLEELHIDNTGTTLSALRPNVAPYPVDA